MADRLMEARLQKLERLHKEGIEAYPTRAQRTHTTAVAAAAFEEQGELQAVVVGRLRSIRAMGKTLFAHLEDGEGRLQLYFREEDLGSDRLTLVEQAFDLGDFIQAEGTLFRTRSGEITLRVQSFRMLAKSLHPLPTPKEEIVDGKRVVHSAFDNPEARYRERYADLAVNPEVREVFRTRARVVDSLRQFLNGLGFLEVETPVLQPIYGGAAAQPFVTHHNQLHQDLYLRISFELYLKRLLVGGLERVYEIGRDFRNEGVDRTRNPEFTQLEFYMAYADYEQVMEITERMVASVAEQVTGSSRISYQGHSIDLAPPWRRVELRRALAERSGIDYEDHPAAESLAAAMRQAGLDPRPGTPRGKLIETLLENVLEPELIQPAFLYDYPRDISPLAKSKPGVPGTVERFEGFVAGMEICNAFTELNDPLDQESRFRELAKTYARDDAERHPMDEDYLRAMRYGMPPNGGFGLGVDRLVMLLTDRPNIREVILFPHLRQKEG
jgi:lysyl-tRNA synthetase class 2